MSNERKLMPYEHQLVDALGISKQEYLDFVAQQQLYSDPKEGTILDVRNEFATIALILTIVGTILQVIGALLLKEEDSGKTQTRDEVFAPRSGFNSVQKLADYGDPVHLVYTNIKTNPNGGVRVSTSLLWSSIKSFGSSQYVQLLLLIGAGPIGEIDAGRSAFGQTPLRDLIVQNYWLYFKPNGTGVLRRGNLLQGSESKQDPGAANAGGNNIYRIQPTVTGANGDGFSHAISPSTSNVFGIYSPVPINVLIKMRFPSGNPLVAISETYLGGLSGWGQSDPGKQAGRIEKGEKLYVTLASSNKQLFSAAEEEAADFRRSVANAFDSAGIMKLGSAKFSIVSINRGSTDDGDMTAILLCTESGVGPSVAYNQIDATGDALFFAKALVKVEIAHYETVSPCHIVDFAIKARVWRRISGRQEGYGTNQLGGYPSTDNGIKRRTAMFVVKFKKKGATEFNYVKAIFVVTRAADVDNFVYFRFNSGLRDAQNADHWQFEMEPVHDSAAEFNTGRLTSPDGRFLFFYLENAGSEVRVNVGGSTSIAFTGAIHAGLQGVGGGKLPRFNNGPRETFEWDLFSNTADTQVQFSMDQGPEFGITAVTEQIAESFANYPLLYDDLSLAGFNLYSGRNVQDLRSLSMFVNQGRRCRLLRTSGTINNIGWGQPGFQYLPPSNVVNSGALIAGTSYYITAIGNSNWAEAGLPLGAAAVGRVFIAKKAVTGTGQVRAGGYANRAPDIFLDTALDANDGIGKYSGDLFAIDLEQLARSKKFCERNKLFMDGLIAEPESWRQFWANNAAFSLLELAKIDGREALIPGVPYEKSSGKIASKETLVTVPIAALFNQGNILEGSYKEEFIDYGTSTEDVIVTIIYRDNEREGAFPRKNSVEVKLTSANEDSALRESIDTSQFVTNKDQAILLGKLLCQTRRHSRRAIEFKTFPTDSYVGPSAYIYVELAQNQWDKIYSGTIGKGGELNLPIADAVKDGDYQFLMYNPNDQSSGTLFRQSVSVVNNVAASLKGLDGHVFVLGKVIRNKRTFRVTEVSMDEEGEVTVRAVEHPTDEDGYSLITEGLASKVNDLFMIDGRDES